MSASPEPSFSHRLIAWQRQHGRHDLPWQNTTDPYRIWLSEIMLQQTQVGTVIPYYQRFLENFPSVADLAAAPVERVLELWAGLGYYARARNLHACAQAVVARHGGQFPVDPVDLAALPGIGRSTAAAIASFAVGARAAILDGNVKRVLCRPFRDRGLSRRQRRGQGPVAVGRGPAAGGRHGHLQPGHHGPGGHPVHPEQAALPGLPHGGHLHRPGHRTARKSCRRPNPGASVPERNHLPVAPVRRAAHLAGTPAPRPASGAAS